MQGAAGFILYLNTCIDVLLYFTDLDLTLDLNTFDFTTLHLTLLDLTTLHLTTFHLTRAT